MMFLSIFDHDFNVWLPIIFRSIGAGVCNLIYWLISKFFQLFMIISQLNILSSTDIEPIYQRVTLILTIVMTFYITLEFIKYVVQPDAMTDKEKGVGNIITRIIIAIVLIAFVPKIFTMAYDVQNKLISNQVFSKVFLGETNTNFETFGSGFSADMLGVFYEVDDDVCGASNDAECTNARNVVLENLENLRNGTEIRIGKNMDVTKEITVNGETQEVFLIKFDGLMAILIGGIILFIVVLYTVDVGVRFAQLLFLQVIAPIAIIGYISPKKDGMFQKWLKQCTTTYLDLFIRLAIIYFVLLIVNILTEAFQAGKLFEGMSGVGFGYETLTYLVLVIGLLIFAKKAPKMLGEILPGGGGAAGIGFGAAPGERWGSAKKLWNAGKRSVGGVAGGLYGLHSARKNNKNKKMSALDKFRSATKAGYRGLKAGAGKGGGIRKGQQAALASIKDDNEVIDKDGTIMGHDFAGVHYQRKHEANERKKTQVEKIKTAKKGVSAATKEIKVVKNAADAKADWDNRSFGDSNARVKACKDIEKATNVYAVSNKTEADKDTYRTKIGEAIDLVYDHQKNPTIQRLDATVKATTQRADETTRKATEAMDAVAKFDKLTTLTPEQQKQKAEAIAARDMALKERDNAIKAKNEAIVALNTEKTVIDAERERVYQNIISGIDKDPQELEILATQIVEMKRVSEGQTYISDGKTKTVPVKTDNATEEAQELAKFAKEIGDVEAGANRDLEKLAANPETRKAAANAAKPSNN